MEGVTTKVLEKEGVTMKVLEKEGVTTKVLEKEGATSKVLEKEGLTMEVLGRGRVTTPLLQQSELERCSPGDVDSNWVVDGRSSSLLNLTSLPQAVPEMKRAPTEVPIRQGVTLNTLNKGEASETKISKR